MADPIPLLSHTEPATPPPPPPQHRSLNDTIEHHISHSAKTQFLQSIILSFAWFFDAQQTFIAVFTDADPKLTSNNNNSPATTSIISEWSLQSAGSLITGLPASAFFLGCLAGGFLLAPLADSSLGRKNLLVLSCLIMSLTGILTSVSTNIWMYALFRFLSGFGRAPIGTCAIVLATELVGKKYRGNVGIIGFILFTFGFLSLPIIAFFLQNKNCSWRFIYLCTCIPCFFYSILVYVSVEESPRWLFIKGRKKEFADSLRRMSSPETQSERFIDGVDWEMDKPQEHDFYSALKILVKKKWALQRLVSLTVVAFGVGMIYIGMPLSLGNLSVNLYVSVAVNALSELPASLAAFFFVGRVNRRSSVLGMAMVSGVCSAACAVVTWRWLQISLEVVSFFASCTAVDVFMIYVLELFPTCVRNSAMSVVRQAIALSGVVSPVVVAAGRRNRWLSYSVFGVTSSVCGLFVLCSPETKGWALCDTMEEEEARRAKFDDGKYFTHLV